jgi:pimeloyl-ACP methyl ester carboxylesterase
MGKVGRVSYAELGTVRLHYVEQGEGPLVVLLHGFPEFWYGWRHQIGPLAEAGFRVVAPDLRGYNLSSKPRGRSAYALPELARDVAELIEERGETSAHVAGHDWGGAVAWATAMYHPERVDRLAILNAPHPRRFKQALLRPRQVARSWYMGFFQLPLVPELLGPKVFPYRDDPRYREAWAQPGALTAMFNYYRGMSPQTRITRVDAPTRVIWGRDDAYLELSLAEPPREDVPNLERVVVLDTSHWVHHEAPKEVTRLLASFFSLP